MLCYILCLTLLQSTFYAFMQKRACVQEYLYCVFSD